MIIVYSDLEIKGVGGIYISPLYFDEVVKGAKLVYTNDAKIKEVYTAAGIETKALAKSAETILKPAKVVKVSDAVK